MLLANPNVWNILAHMKTICVYCGSANHASRKYFLAAQSMGETFARAGLTLVYGGGRTGLMGALADGVLNAGGQVIGVIVTNMNTPELAHTRLTRMEVSDTIHQRKARMYALADGYIALPGGYGTLDELFETLTWAQIGEHQKPVGLLNVDGYYDSLLIMLDRATAEGFIFPEHRASLLCETDPQKLLAAMAAHRYPHEAAQRWMRQE